MVPIEALHAVASIQIRYQKVKLNQAKQTESPQHLRSGCFSRLSSKKSYFLVVINKHAEKKVSMEREQQRQKTVNAVWAEDNIIYIYHICVYGRHLAVIYSAGHR